jgi:hypothetical protein
MPISWQYINPCHHYCDEALAKKYDLDNQAPYRASPRITPIILRNPMGLPIPPESFVIRPSSPCITRPTVKTQRTAVKTLLLPLFASTNPARTSAIGTFSAKFACVRKAARRGSLALGEMGEAED